MREPRALVSSRWDRGRIAFNGSPVWMVNLPLMLRCLASSLLLSAAAIDAASRGWSLIWPVCVVMLAYPLLLLLYRVWETELTHIVIDDARLTWHGGILTRRVASVELYRIENVEARSDWWERIFGFGTLVIESSDVNRPLWVLRGLPEVERLRDALTEYVVAVHNTMGIGKFNVGRV
ncbi:PH domain-containing protein [Paraburkholderia ginsengisoli]|uniref:PH domain-containing protein n=1 Tax=Paraburkholderia ginsengisoli TaxID=311231 RepID=A0A7T4TCA2_9BURK|nr:PH domain-containing protein [Paraburkholderia ginsengisoli]QQC67845.1 PH domain-containing protein [Paraburkholderia ginsengisoli]